MILQNGKRIDGCSDTVPVGTLQPYLGLVPPKGYLVCQGQLVSKITYSKLYEICGDTFGTSTETHFYLPDLRGKTLAGYDENDIAMNTIGKLLGQKTHTHTSAAHTHTIAGHTHTSAAHTHSTGNHTLTANEMPSHYHTTRTYSTNYNQGVTIPENRTYAISFNTDAGNWAWSGNTAIANAELCNGATTDLVGGSQAHNHGNTGSTTPGNTGSTSLTSDSTTPGATGSNTNYQPTITVNWIVKAVMLIPDYIIVEDTLNSDSAVDALSARQGKLLNEKFTDYATKSEMIQYLPLSGGQMTGEIKLGQGDGYGIQLNTNGRINATLDGQSNATVLGILDASVIVGHTSAPLLLRGSYSAPLYNGVALVESGSNSNGSYMKLIDGTMICYHSKSISVECTSQWGQLYEGGAAIGNLPATFISAPIVMVTNTTPDGYFEGVRDTTKSTWGTLRMAIPTSATRTFIVNFFAIGRWK